MPQPEADSAIVALATQGDANAFGMLYEKHAARVFRHLYYLLGNRTEADDLTSETFLRAWTAIRRYEDRGLSIESWLLKIGHNLATKHLTRFRAPLTIEGINLEADERSSPEGIAEATSEADVVRQAILKLPGLQRQIVVWRFLESMSYEEVGKMLGKSQGAIRVLQFRALKRLRALLEEPLFSARARPEEVFDATGELAGGRSLALGHAR